MHRVPPFVRRSQLPIDLETANWSTRQGARELEQVIIKAWARCGVRARCVVSELGKDHYSVRLVEPESGLPDFLREKAA